METASAAARLDGRAIIYADAYERMAALLRTSLGDAHPVHLGG